MKQATRSRPHIVFWTWPLEPDHERQVRYEVGHRVQTIVERLLKARVNNVVLRQIQRCMLAQAQQETEAKR